MGQDPRVQRWVVLEFARERDRVASNFLGAGLAPLVGVLPDETDAESRGDGLKMLDGLVEDSSAALNIGPRPLSGKARRRRLRGEMVLGGPNNLEPGGSGTCPGVCAISLLGTLVGSTRTLSGGLAAFAEALLACKSSCASHRRVSVSPSGSVCYRPM